MSNKTLIWIELAVLIFCLIALFGCKTQQPTTIVRDIVRVEYKLDSIYLYERDSIYVDKWRSNDTIYVTTEKWLTRYKDKVVQVHDTIAVDNSNTIVEQVSYTPPFYKTCTLLFWIVAVLVLGVVVWKKRWVSLTTTHRKWKKAIYTAGNTQYNAYASNI